MRAIDEDGEEKVRNVKRRILEAAKNPEENAQEDAGMDAIPEDQVLESHDKDAEMPDQQETDKMSDSNKPSGGTTSHHLAVRRASLS